MTCDDVVQRLDEYVDGELTEAGFQEVELHLASCAECRGQERELRALLARASALPREILPPRDLWPELEARLRGPEGLRLQAGRRALFGAPPAVLAAAAAVLVAVTALVWTRGRTAAPAPSVAALPAPELRSVSAGGALPAVLEAEKGYARATASLMAALDKQGEALSPESRAVLEANLATIDQALAQVRAALEKDPGNAQLAHLLTSTHQKKVDALQRVVRLNRL